MSVVDGQAVSAAVTNPAFLKPDVNDYTLKKLGSRNTETGAGYYIEDFQKYLNNLGTISGLDVSANYTAEADTTGNTYGSTSSAVSNGDTFKAAIKKLSDLFAATKLAGSHTHTGTSGDGAQINLTNGVTGILPMFNGGTNANLTPSAGAIPYSTATAIALLSAGTSGQILQSTGASAPQWTTATYPTTTTANQILYSSATNTVGQITAAATSALVTNSSSVPSLTSGTTANRVLRTNGTAISFAQVALSTDVTGTLPVGNGGTGLTSGVSGAVAYFNASNSIASSAMLEANQIVLGGGTAQAPLTLGGLGTTTTVLHGNATGAPSWGAVSLTADVSGTLPIANGGTGETSAANAINALLPSQATNGDKFLTTDGSVASWGYAVSAVGTVGSTPAAAGASISGKTLTLQPANGTNGGLVSTTTQTFAGDKTFNGSASLQAKLSVNKTTDSTTTGTGASLAANPATIYVAVTNASLVSINNIPAPASGYQVFFLQNATGVSITITNDSGGTAANRILTGTGADLTLTNKLGIWLAYDTTDSRWFVIGGSGGGGGGGTTYLGVVTKTANYSMSTSDNVVLASTTGGATTSITLPSVTQSGQLYRIKKTDASGLLVKVTTGTSATIDGESSDRYLFNQYESITVVSDGSNWFIV